MRINCTPPLSFEEENVDRYCITFTDGTTEWVEGDPKIYDTVVVFTGAESVTFVLSGIRKWQKAEYY